MTSRGAKVRNHPARYPAVHRFLLDPTEQSHVPHPDRRFRPGSRAPQLLGPSHLLPQPRTTKNLLRHDPRNLPQKLAPCHSPAPLRCGGVVLPPRCRAAIPQCRGSRRSRVGRTAPCGPAIGTARGSVGRHWHWHGVVTRTISTRNASTSSQAERRVTGLRPGARRASAGPSRAERRHTRRAYRTPYIAQRR
jgi:hypothetical protein